MNATKPSSDRFAAEKSCVEADSVREELERIITSSKFRASERTRQFLRFVVEETLAGRADAIKAYSIAVNCFGREPDFDPQLDPYVRIVARRLRRTLSHYYEEEGARDLILIDIPKGTYVPVFRERDTTAEPAREENVEPEPSGGHVALAVGASSGGSSVAVVPFEGYGADDGEAFLASGLTQEIILNLTRFAEIQVLGPFVPVAGASPHEIGGAYGANFALAGTVQKIGDRLRVNVSLVDVETTEVLWAERYNREVSVDQFFAVQDEIARTVAGTVGDAAGVIVRRVSERTRTTHPDNLSTYEAALKGFHWGMVLTEGAFEEAHRALERAVAVDPGYALTKALLSDIYFSDWLSAVGRFDGGLERAESLARDAVELEPHCGDARWALGQVHYARRRFEEFKEEFEAAKSINPNKAMYQASFGLFLVGLQEWEQAVEMVTQAICLNPQHPSWYHLVPFMDCGRRGEWEEALVEARSFLGPGLMWGPLARAAALGHVGRTEEAERHVQDLLAVQPEFRDKGREMISRLLYADDNVDLVLDGLRRAGLEVGG